MELNADGSISVADVARGIPVDLEPRTGLSGVEVVFTKLHAGGKFGAGSYNATGGLHGVGASVVNALSSRLDVEVDRNGATWALSFRRGVPGTFAGDGPDAPFTPGAKLAKVGRAARGRTGTRVRYWPDRQIFLPDAQLSLPHLVARARQTSFLVPGLELVVTDARSGEPSTEVFKHDGGISEFCDFLAGDAPVTDVLRLRGTDSFTETVPMLDDDGANDAHRRRPHPRRRHCAALGSRIRHHRAVVREHHCDPEGRHPPRRLRAWAGPRASPGPGRDPAAEGG